MTQLASQGRRHIVCAVLRVRCCISRVFKHKPWAVGRRAKRAVMREHALAQARGLHPMTRVPVFGSRAEARVADG